MISFDTLKNITFITMVIFPPLLSFWFFIIVPMMNGYYDD